MLLVHDAATERQRLVIETSLRNGTGTLGWLVPVPARPVATVAKRSVFPALARALPSSVWSEVGLGRAAGEEAPAPDPAEVDASARLHGRLTATVIDARDGDALRRWRTSVGLAQTPADEAWQQHYASVEYWYVALRFDPPAVLPQGPPAEVAVRLPPIEIDFASALPFLPFCEPAHPRPVVEQARELHVWLVAAELGNPIALDTAAKPARYLRPLTAQYRWKDGRALVLEALGPDTKAPIPEGALTVMTFSDSHVERDGLGDIVFGAFQFREELAAPSEARREALRPLMRALDPALAPSAHAPSALGLSGGSR